MSYRMTAEDVGMAVPRLTVREAESVADCEGVVLLTAQEIEEICSAGAFTRLNPSQRAMHVACMCEWADGGGPANAARLTRDAIHLAMQS